MSAQGEVNLVSDRRWLMTALCAVMGGWFGLQRFYLRRYASGALRLLLLLAAVYCGSNIKLGESGMLWRICLFALLGAVADLLMIVMGPALFRRRSLIDLLYVSRRIIPGKNIHRRVIPGRNIRSSIIEDLVRYLLTPGNPVQPLPRIDGTWLTVPILLAILACLFFSHAQMEIGVKLRVLGFIGFSVLVGVYWVRDCARIFYLCNLTDRDGRLPQ